MQKLLPSIQKNIKIKYRCIVIDNLVFRLHYTYTTALMFLMTLLLTSQELIGEHIKCVGSAGVPGDIMNRYCYFISTFTVVKHMNETALDRGDILHPGVGALGGVHEEDEVKRHNYYQWVTYVLFAQSILFVIPHLIWKSREGARMKKLVAGLEYAAFSSQQVEKPITVGGKTIPTKATVKEEFDKIKKYFKDNLEVNRFWAVWLVTCELMNFANVILNIYITHAFLDGQFLGLGPKLIREGVDSSVDPLDVVFPKMTKCTYYKYGPSGTLQPHDAMCVMAQNILNEKAYTVLWFWFAFLLAVSGMVLVWRALTFCLYSRSRSFNKLVFSYASAGRVNIWELMTVTQNCDYMHWMFLVYLAKNMNSLVFLSFLEVLAEESRPTLHNYYGGLLDHEERSGYSSEETGEEPHSNGSEKVKLPI